MLPDFRASVAPIALLLVVIAGAPASAQSPEAPGSIAGRVTDAVSGAPLAEVAVVLIGPTAGGEGEPLQELRLTGADGAFAFDSVSAGSYRLDFTHSGYRASSISEVAALSGRENRADHALSPRSGGEASQETGDASGPIENLIVQGDPTDDLLGSIEVRSQSDQLVNVLGAEDLSKFAAVDMADALKRVAGVNVVEGQFAIIRGLEDRYSSTLYNGTPVPSPDPDRQSIQLDLFPSEIVSQVVIAKTFGPDLPSNSSGGSINIITPDHPDEPFELSVSAKTGINENAYGRFLEFKGGSPVGDEDGNLAALESEYGAAVKGRTGLFDREIRYKAVANWGRDFGTEEGFQEGRQPATFQSSAHFPAGDLAFGELSLTDGRFDLTTSERAEQLTLYGGFGFDIDEFGDHGIDASVFYSRKDSEVVQLRENGYLAGFNYAVVTEAIANGENNADFASYYDGTSGVFVAGKNATPSAWIATGVKGNPNDGALQGFPYFSSFFDSRSFENRRDLLLYQVDGDHILDVWIDGLHFGWAGNYATTSQEDDALGARFSYEPCGGDGVLGCPEGVTPITRVPGGTSASFPISVQALGPGKYMARKGLFASSNEIDEDAYFGRLDGDYERELFRWLVAELRSGLWYEHASRDVDSSFLNRDRLTASCPEEQGCFTGGTGGNFVLFGDSPQQLGSRIFSINLQREADGSISGTQPTRSKATREIQALNVGGKATFWEDFDVLGGVRLENIFIESKNDPFARDPTDIQFDGSPRIFPSKYLFFDRLDNPERSEPFRSPPYNDQILGIDVPSGPCRDLAGNPIPEGQPGSGQCVDLIDRAEIQSLVNGEIDENHVLPSAGLSYRPFEWVTLRGAYSQTVARPSFREIGYYVSIEPGTDDLSVGNPQLGLSEVESWDARVEFVWGNFSDLVAVSVFDKTIEDPIEQIVVRDPGAFEATFTDSFRTFFNNPNEGTIRGIEVEARKSLGFLTLGFLDFELPGLSFLEYLSVGGNYSYFDAEVKRTEPELARSVTFFGDTDGNPQGAQNPPGPTPYQHLHRKRRLYAQPEWIANADISFDHPVWGTQATLAFFAISDLLDAAGVATPNQSGRITSFTLDRYVDSYHQLDLILSQKLWRGFAVKVSMKNLTDSKRAIIYDPEQTGHRIPEREYRRGRDYSLSVSWTF